MFNDVSALSDRLFKRKPPMQERERFNLGYIHLSRVLVPGDHVAFSVASFSPATCQEARLSSHGAVRFSANHPALPSHQHSSEYA